MRRTKMTVSVFISAVFLWGMTGIFTGCGFSERGAGITEEASEEAGRAGDTEETAKEFEGVTLSLLNFSATTPGGVLENTCAAAEEKFGFKIEIEGCNDDNVVRTRLAAGECPDLLIYNTGSLLYSLSPSEFFIDLTETKIAERLDADFIQAASVDGVLYGIPQGDSTGAGVFYNKELYRTYGLSEPETWEEFLGNLQALKNAGLDGMGISLNELVSSQLPFLADNYQVMYRNPDFAREFTLGNISFAESAEGLRSWERYEELTPYFNEDCASASKKEIEERFFEGGLGHVICFTSQIPGWIKTYGEKIDNVGFFALPGDTGEETGLTVWPSNGIYGYKKSKNIEAVTAFMEWYISEEGLEVLTSFYSPAGVFHTGYEPKGQVMDLVSEVHRYYREGKTMPALEYMTPVKGINCSRICSELGNRRISARDAAEAYDEDCRKMALQIGLWKQETQK